MVTQNYKQILDALFDSRFGPQKTHAALSSGIQQGVSYTQSIAKVKTGNLKGKISGKVLDDVTAEFKSDADYSKFVNDGTFRMGGDGFFDKGVAVIEKTIRENLSKL